MVKTVKLEWLLLVIIGGGLWVDGKLIHPQLLNATILHAHKTAIYGKTIHSITKE